tara:strand:- start:7155 stop:7604 length:450 start_codon:yes stop_codon:yes gene_type:complete
MYSVVKAMRKSSLFLVLSVFSFACFSQNDTTAVNDCVVKKNGIYYAKYDKETNLYIRFHDGDTAVTTSSTNNVGAAAKFVTKRLGEEMLMGKYLTSENSCNIRIKAKNEYSKVKMDGFISGDKLALSVINIIDNTSRDFVFKFYPTSSK